MLVPAFQLRLPDPILPGKAAVGKFDGTHPCLAAATAGGKVLVHNPHVTPGQPQVSYLNVNGAVTGLAAGPLDPALGRDLLLIATATHLQAYDVHANRELFYVELPDGASCLLLGTLPGQPAPLALVGGASSVTGLNAAGVECFWTVTGSPVGALSFCDVDGDGQQELLVGSDDCQVRVLRGDAAATHAASEADRVVGLAAIHRDRFGYALVNGTVGVYAGAARAWRVKSKHSVGAIAAHDLDGDGTPELISGWSNGRVEVRSDATGEVIFKDSLSAAIAALLRADYRGDGCDQVIAVAVNGEVRGYLPADPAAAGKAYEVEQQAKALVELNTRKQELLLELAAYQASTRTTAGSLLGARDVASPIPAATKCEGRLVMNAAARRCEVVLASTCDTVIKAAALFAEQVFEGESLLHYAASPAPELAVPLALRQDAAVTMLVKAFVSVRASPVYHVFELEVALPQFSMYASVPAPGTAQPQSHVAFATPDRIPRLATWLRESFLDMQNLQQTGDSLQVHLVSLRDGLPLVITAASGGQMRVHTDNMQLAAEVVAALAASLNIGTLTSSAHFPAQMQDFAAVLAKVEEASAVRVALAGEVADGAGLVKAALVRGEDARLLADAPVMRRHYARLQDVNRGLMAEHSKRATNHAELLDALRSVNAMIQTAAKLRTGEPKARAVAACRAAVKDNNAAALLRVIQEGA